MAQALTGRGRRVRAFSDPIRALAALTLDGADLLVADLSMPWIDGKDVVASARLRKPDLAIFLVSGYPRGAEIAAEEGVPFAASVRKMTSRSMSSIAVPIGILMTSSRNGPRCSICGKSDGASSLSRARSTACSTTLRSSRTLPGQL